MKVLSWRLLHTLFYMGIFTAKVFGLSQKVSEVFTGSFAKTVVKKFGMAKGGVVNIDFDVVPEYPNSEDNSYTLVVVTTEEERAGFFNEIGDSVVTNPSVISNLCMQPSMGRLVARGSGSFNMTISDNYQSDQYSVILMQCRPSVASNPVHVNIKIIMQNPGPVGSSFSHLPIEEVNMLRIYGGEGILYMIFVLISLSQMIFYRPQIKEIHLFFYACITANFVVLMMNYNAYKDYDSNGLGVSTSTQIGIGIFEAIADSLSLGTIFLLSLGWTLLRSQLSERERRLVGYGVFSYFMFSIGSAVCVVDESICTSVSLVAFILRNLLLLSIIVAMNFTVTHLRILLTHSPWVPSTPIQYARCKQYQIFRLVYILYLFMPTIIYIVQSTTFTWKEDWIVMALNEMTTIGILFFVGVTFGPMQEAFLLRAFDGSINAVRA